MSKLTRSLLGLALVVSATLHAGTPLSRAVIDGSLDATKDWLSKGEKVNDYDKWGWTPLHWAVYYNHTLITEYLLDHGADPNLPALKAYGSMNLNATPLIIAGYYGLVPEAQFLLKHGAKTGLTDQAGMKAAGYAKQYGFTDLHDLLTQPAAPAR